MFSSSLSLSLCWLFLYLLIFCAKVKFSQDNFPDSDSEILPICSSAGAVASRLLLITIADRERVRNYHVQIHQAIFFTLGAVTMSLSLATDFVWLIVVVTIQGMCDGAYFCLIGPIAIKTVGVLDSSQAVGFYIGLCGLSMTVGLSMAGKKKSFFNWSTKRVTRITMQTYSEAEIVLKPLTVRLEGRSKPWPVSICLSDCLSAWPCLCLSVCLSEYQGM